MGAISKFSHPKITTSRKTPTPFANTISDFIGSIFEAEPRLELLEWPSTPYTRKYCLRYFFREISDSFREYHRELLRKALPVCALHNIVERGLQVQAFVGEICRL